MHTKWSYSWEEFITTDFSHFGGLLAYTENNLVYNFYQADGAYYVLEKTFNGKQPSADLRKNFNLKNEFDSQRAAGDYLASRIPAHTRASRNYLFSIVVFNHNLE